jgi:hypothetical protein
MREDCGLELCGEEAGMEKSSSRLCRRLEVEFREPMYTATDCLRIRDNSHSLLGRMREC